MGEIAAGHPRVIFLRVEPAETSVGAKILGGWHWSRGVQPTATLRLALSADESLFAAMHPKTRYNIRLAERKGVSVTRVEASPKMIHMFWGLLRETAARDGFTLHAEAYYEQMLRHVPSALFVASWNGQPLAAALVAFFGTTAYYLHGGSASIHRDAQAPVALHWVIMRDVRQQGMTVYDLWGADEVRWPGVTRFKRGFAPDLPLTEYAGAFDWPLSRFPYVAYAAAQRVMQFVRGRRG